MLQFINIEELSATLKEHKIPLSTVADHDSLFALVDSKGGLKKVWEVQNYPHSIVKKVVARERNVFRLFSMPEVGTIDEFFPHENRPFFLKNALSLEILKSQGFHTDMPYLVLNLHASGGMGFFGKITLNKYMPNISYTGNSAVLYIDAQERLRGFNVNLLKGLSPSEAERIRAMLGRPVSGLMEPTPRMIQERHFASARALPAGGWKKTWERTSFGPGDFSLSEEGIGVSGSGPVLWRNESRSFAHSFFPETLDTRVTDFRFSVDCRVSKGDGPFLSVGSAEYAKSDLDDHIYEAGKSYRESSFSIKRIGFVVSSGPGRLPEGRSRFTLCKVGAVISLEINGSPAVRYFDPEFEHEAEALFRLMIRPGTEVKIHGVLLESRPVRSAGPEEAEANLVRLKPHPDKAFLMSRFHNLALASTLSDVMGFVLADVTDIERRAGLYRKRFRQEQRRREELKSLLAKSEPARVLLVGSGKAMNSVRERVELVARSGAPVLIQGATGTGKEVLARLIHAQSGRMGRFVKIDCSALPSELIESELFGHEKGAFTGAIDRKIGRFEQAQGGTIFLDEISNLGRGVQAKLLNVLQDLSIMRIGGSDPVPLDVRVVTASNIRLEGLIRQGLFREDLYYRINAVSIDLPDLKDRKEDIPELCRHFMEEMGGRELTPEAYQKLFNHAWPGNVRELRNVLQKAVLFSRDEAIAAEAVQMEGAFTPAASMKARKREFYHLKAMTREEWTALLKKHRGLVTGVAGELNATRRTCYRNFRKHGIDPNGFRQGG